MEVCKLQHLTRCGLVDKSKLEQTGSSEAQKKTQIFWKWGSHRSEGNKRSGKYFYKQNTQFLSIETEQWSIWKYIDYEDKLYKDWTAQRFWTWPLSFSFPNQKLWFGKHVSLFLIIKLWKCDLFSCARLFAMSWTVARQAHLFMEFSRQEYGVPILHLPSSRGSSPHLGPECGSAPWHTDSLLSEPLWRLLQSYSNIK